MSLTVKLFTILVLSSVSSNLFAFGKASHVVVIVWDGMRPDFVSEETTPTLTRLARQGVTFRNHHPVYLSTTEVNGTALATGVYPGESGIIANKEFRPAIDASNKIKTESLAAVRKGDELTGGHYLGCPTVAEMLQSQGLRTAIAGAKGVVLLHFRLDSSAAPDIVLSMRWRPDKSTNGTAGLICSDYGQYSPGHGMHGSLSPFDMHNTCVAAGPDFRKGVEDDTPSGNIDIAPTILWLLGIKPEQPLSGRVLAEALVQADAARPSCEVHRLEASYSSAGFTWRQYLKYSQVSGVLYFEEGNGEQVSRRPIGGN